MSAAILASKNRIAPCQSMVFSDKNLKSFLSRYYTPLGRKMWPNKRMKFSIRTCTHNQRMPDARGFFRAGKAIFGRHTCRMARKMNAVCLKKHRADHVRWLCIQVLIVSTLENRVPIFKSGFVCLRIKCAAHRL